MLRKERNCCRKNNPESLLPIVTVCGGCVTVREVFWVTDLYKGVVSDFILSENISVYRFAV